MRILIVAFSKIKYAPYINFYLENIDASRHDVHLLYWNRDLKAEDVSHLKDVKLHEFRCYMEDDIPKTQKFGKFFEFRRFTINVLREESFDILFILTSLPSVLLYDQLKKQYSGRYIFDYRDYTYEWFAPYKWLLHRVIHHSRAAYVSSDAFRRFLPKNASEKIHTSHNILLDSLNHREDGIAKRTLSNKIRISFWGFIREKDINCALIQKIAADSRFELHFYGREQSIALSLKKYAAEIGAENIVFHGEYRPEDRYDFVAKTDIIHNLYQSSNMMPAMSNKYYDGVIFRLPQLCTQGSFMAEQCEKAGVGKAVDVFSNDFLDKVYAYYSELDRPVFNAACDSEMERVYKEYIHGCKIIYASTEKTVQ